MSCLFERLIMIRSGVINDIDNILSLEKDVEEAEQQLKRVANDIIRAETGGNVK